MFHKVLPFAPALTSLGLAAALVLSACGDNSPQSAMATGKAASAKGDHKTALVAFKAALQADPNSQEARLMLGKELLAADDPAGAIVVFEKALDSKVPAELVLPDLSRALLLIGDYNGLTTKYGAIELQDKLAQAGLKSSVAMAWGTLGERAKTEAALAAALAASPDFGPALLVKARILAGAQKLDEAVALVDKVLAKDPQAYDGWVLRGDILQFKQAPAADIESSYAKALAIRKDYLPAHAAVIAMRIRRRDVDGARAQADALRAVMPKHPLTVMVDAQLAYIDRQLPKSRELLQGLLKILPNHPGILLLAGVVEGELGSTGQAVAHFTKAVQLYPTMVAARTNLASAQVRQGQYSAALDTLKPLAASGSPPAEVLALMGDAELRMGNPTAAEGHFLQAAKLDPGNGRLQTIVAAAKLWKGQADAGLAELEALSAKSADTFADEALFAARMKRREYDQALAVIGTMAKKAPKNATYPQWRGSVHKQRKDYAAARAAFEEAQKLDPRLFGPVAELAELDIIENKLQQAHDRLKASIAADPKNPAAILALADLQVRRQAPNDEIRGLLNQAVGASVTAVEPRLRLIDFLVRKRLFKDAIAATQEAVSALPNEPRVIEAAGRAQALSGDLEQAATNFRKLASLQPDSPDPYLRLAEVYASSGKREQAASVVSKALEIAPDYGPAQAAMVELLSASNRKREALDFIRRIQLRWPDRMAGYAMEATYQVKAKDENAAIAVLRQGLQKTDNPDLASRLYMLLAQTGRGSEADAFASAWLKRRPGDLRLEFLVSTVEMSRGALPAAQQRLERIIAAEPNNVAALNNSAWIMTQLGDKRAVAVAQRAVELEPDQAPLLDTLAGALAGDNQLAKAVEVQKRAVEIAPNEGQFRLNLAKFAVRAGDKALARQELEKLKALGGAFSGQAEAAKLLQLL